MNQLKKNPSEVWLEIGGGERPVVHPRCLGGPDVHFDVRSCWDGEGRQVVDFTHDCSKFPLPLKDAEFDGAVLCFCLEHVGFAAVPNLLKELARVVKPGGSLVLLLPNTAAQMAWIQRPENGSGWDGKDFFTSASELLFGSQDMEGDANSHRSFFTPTVVTNLLVDAGWESVVVAPHNPRATDMLVRANRVVPTEQPNPDAVKCPSCGTWNQEPSEDTMWRCWKCEHDFLKAHSDDLPLERGGEAVDRGKQPGVESKNCRICGQPLGDEPLAVEASEGSFGPVHVRCVQLREKKSSPLVAADIGEELLFCGAVSPAGLRCSRPRGHEGRHAAETQG